jgi:SNF2 family DNA or RNA helicase
VGLRHGIASIDVADRKVRTHVSFDVAGGDVGLFELTPVQDVEISASGNADDRFSIAARRLVELDAAAARALKRGRSIKVRIPLVADPLPTPFTGTAEEIWSSLPPVGALLRPILAPADESADLMPYQEIGADWLEHQQAAILADDMGLGKTVQAITALARLLRRGVVSQALVIAPRTVLATWESELSRWAPDLTRLRVVPTAVAREEAWRVIRGRVHVAITNYEQLRDPPEALSNEPCDLLIADEAHRLRNLQSRVTREIAALPRARVWALTGTPLERDSLDVATLLSLLDPNRFSRQDARLPVAALRARAKPYTLRRRKTEVLDELPEVIESSQILDLLPAQRSAYDQLSRSPIGPSSGDVLNRITELRRICDIEPVSRESVKADRITEILEEVRAASEKAVVFSHLLEPLAELVTRLKQTPAIQFVHLTGASSGRERDEIVRRFIEDESVAVMLASARVAGEGLTLTAANHALFFNEWWNPSADAQARDRVVRIGQKRGVRVYRFRCRDTIEENLERILETKRELFGSLVDQMSSGQATDRQLLMKVLRGSPTSDTI